MKELFAILLIFIPLFSNAQVKAGLNISDDNKAFLDSLIYVGEYEIAIQYLDELIKIDSVNPYLYCYSGVLKESIYPNDKSSLTDYKQAISIESNSALAHWLCGKQYLGLIYGQDYFNKIAYLDNDSTFKRFNEYYLDSAIYYYEKLLEIDSSWLYSVRSSLYDLYLSKGLVSKATNIKESDYQIPIMTDSLNVPLNSSVYYFPIEYLIDTINIFPGHTVLDDGFIYRRTDLAHFRNYAYSSRLFAFEEPLLYNGFFKHDSYRFTWLRSFDEPVVIRVENNEESIRLFAKMTNKKGGYEAGEIIINDTIMLNAVQWTELIEKLDEINFRNIYPTENTHGLMGEDGARWILEGLKDGQYHMIDRWSGYNKETGEPCLYLLKLSGLEVDNIY